MKFLTNIFIPNLMSIAFTQINMKPEMTTFIVKHSSSLTTLSLLASLNQCNIFLILSRCTRLKSLTFSFGHSIPLCISHPTVMNISITNIFRDLEKITKKLQPKLDCFTSEDPISFPSLQEIHLHGFHHSILYNLDRSMAQHSYWSFILRKCISRCITIYDEMECPVYVDEIYFGQ